MKTSVEVSEGVARLATLDRSTRESVLSLASEKEVRSAVIAHCREAAFALIKEAVKAPDDLADPHVREAWSPKITQAALASAASVVRQRPPRASLVAGRYPPLDAELRADDRALPYHEGMGRGRGRYRRFDCPNCRKRRGQRKLGGSCLRCDRRHNDEARLHTMALQPLEEKS